MTYINAPNTNTSFNTAPAWTDYLQRVKRDRDVSRRILALSWPFLFDCRSSGPQSAYLLAAIRDATDGCPFTSSKPLQPGCNKACKWKEPTPSLTTTQRRSRHPG